MEWSGGGKGGGGGGVGNGKGKSKNGRLTVKDQQGTNIHLGIVSGSERGRKGNKREKGPGRSGGKAAFDE